jgi:hypothetical protein
MIRAGYKRRRAPCVILSGVRKKLMGKSVTPLTTLILIVSGTGRER